MMTEGLSSPVDYVDPSFFDKKPMVSVVMLAYNHADYIRKAVRGVLGQQGVSFELLVGEDASTDVTLGILLELQRAYPTCMRVLAWPRNVGMRDNAMMLERYARGAYIASCEGDDYWILADKLSRQVDCMQHDPACGLVHGNYLNLKRIGGCWRTRIAFRDPAQLAGRDGELYEALLHSNRIQTCTVLLRRELIVRYRTEMPSGDSYLFGDWPLFLFIARHSRIGFIEQPVAAYRRTPGSATNSGARSSLARGLDAIRMVDDFCDFFGDPDSVRYGALASQHRTLLSLAFTAGDGVSFEVAWDWLAKARPDLLCGWRVQGMRFLMSWPRIARGWVRLLQVVESVKHWLEFGPEERAP